MYIDVTIVPIKSVALSDDLPTVYAHPPLDIRLEKLSYNKMERLWGYRCLI